MRKCLTSILTIMAMTFLVPAFGDELTDKIEAGQTLFAGLCASCHGENGDGNGPVAETMILKPRDFAMAEFKFDTDADWQRGTDQDLSDVIRQGPGAYGGSALMPEFSHLDDEQVNSLIHFIRAQSDRSR